MKKAEIKATGNTGVIPCIRPIETVEVDEIKNVLEVAQEEYNTAKKDFEKYDLMRVKISMKYTEVTQEVSELTKEIRRTESSYKRSSKPETLRRLCNRLVALRKSLDKANTKREILKDMRIDFLKRYYDAESALEHAKKSVGKAAKQEGFKYIVYTKNDNYEQKSYAKTMASAASTIYYNANGLSEWKIRSLDSHNIYGEPALNTESFTILSYLIKKYDKANYEQYIEAEFATAREKVEYVPATLEEEFKCIMLRSIHNFTFDKYTESIEELKKFVVKASGELQKKALSELQEWIKIARAEGVEVEDFQYEQQRKLEDVPVKASTNAIKFEVGKYYFETAYSSSDFYTVYKCVNRRENRASTTVTFQECLFINSVEGKMTEMRGDTGTFKISVNYSSCNRDPEKYNPYEEVRLDKRQYVWACSLFDANTIGDKDISEETTAEENPEVAVEEYAVTPEALEVATQAEIDNMAKNALAEIVQKALAQKCVEDSVQFLIKASWAYSLSGYEIIDFENQIRYYKSLKVLRAKSRARLLQAELIVARIEQHDFHNAILSNYLLNLAELIKNAPDDDGSNDEPDDDFLATLDTSIDEDTETDELLDEPEIVYTAIINRYENGKLKSHRQEFKSAVEAYNFLKENRLYESFKYSKGIEEYHSITSWDGSSTTLIDSSEFEKVSDIEKAQEFAVEEVTPEAFEVYAQTPTVEIAHAYFTIQGRKFYSDATATIRHFEILVSIQALITKGLKIYEVLHEELAQSNQYYEIYQAEEEMANDCYRLRYAARSFARKAKRHETLSKKAWKEHGKHFVEVLGNAAAFDRIEKMLFFLCEQLTELEKPYEIEPVTIEIEVAEVPAVNSNAAKIATNRAKVTTSTEKSTIANFIAIAERFSNYQTSGNFVENQAVIFQTAAEIYSSQLKIWKWIIEVAANKKKISEQ